MIRLEENSWRRRRELPHTFTRLYELYPVGICDLETTVKWQGHGLQAWIVLIDARRHVLAIQNCQLPIRLACLL
jgi:hypothetical protein